MKIFLIGVTIFFNCYWIWYFYTKHNCTKEIKARFAGKTKFRGGSFKDEYILLFKYNYQGIEYEEKSFETYPKKKVIDCYTTGEEYSILLNPKHPQYFIMEKNIQMYDVTLIAAGIVAAVITFIYYVHV